MAFIGPYKALHSVSVNKGGLALHRDSLALAGDILSLSRDSLILYRDSLSLYEDTVTLSKGSLALAGGSLALFGLVLAMGFEAMLRGTALSFGLLGLICWRRGSRGRTSDRLGRRVWRGRGPSIAGRVRVR